MDLGRIVTVAHCLLLLQALTYVPAPTARHSPPDTPRSDAVEIDSDDALYPHEHPGSFEKTLTFFGLWFFEPSEEMKLALKDLQEEMSRKEAALAEEGNMVGSFGDRLWEVGSDVRRE